MVWGEQNRKINGLIVNEPWDRNECHCCMNAVLIRKSIFWHLLYLSWGAFDNEFHGRRGEGGPGGPYIFKYFEIKLYIIHHF